MRGIKLIDILKKVIILSKGETKARLPEIIDEYSDPNRKININGERTLKEVFLKLNGNKDDIEDLFGY